MDRLFDGLTLSCCTGPRVERDIAAFFGWRESRGSPDRSGPIVARPRAGIRASVDVPRVTGRGRAGSSHNRLHELLEFTAAIGGRFGRQ